MDLEDPGRREFLKKSILVLGGLMASGIAFPSIVYFLAPIWTRSEADWVELASIKEIPLGQPIKLDFIQRKKDGWAIIAGRSSSWVVTEDGRNFTVFDPHCTHLGCPYNWNAEKNKFLCPCHNAAFARDGRVLYGPPPRPLDQLPHKVVGGKLLIQPVAKKG